LKLLLLIFHMRQKSCNHAVAFEASCFSRANENWLQVPCVRVSQPARLIVVDRAKERRILFCGRIFVKLLA
jgi:hypothetical protein